jgi:hypothetical protein
MIQAQPTVYRGIRFRSKTEARWAVFFDNLDITWVYEPTRQQISSGTYHVDFYIPDWDVYVEVKGSDPTDLEIRKCVDLASVEHKKVLLLQNTPGNSKGEIMVYDNSFDWAGPFHFARCRRCDGFWLISDLEGGVALSAAAKSCDRCPEKYPVEDDGIKAAAHKARIHRFEISET